MSNSYKLNKKCSKCNIKISDKNKSGFCILHVDRTGSNNPFYGKKHSQSLLKIIALKNSIASKQKWKDKQYRDKVIKNSSKPRSQQGKKNISNGVKKSYNDHLRLLRSQQMKKDWKQGNITKNNNNYNSISKKQLQFYYKIKLYFPNALLNETIKLDNNKWIFADVLLPQFNIILQFNGDYWHANPKYYNQNDIIKNRLAKDIWQRDLKRIKILQSNKYDVFIIWESEWKKDSQSILQNLQNLINWQSCIY